MSFHLRPPSLRRDAAVRPGYGWTPPRRQVRRLSAGVHEALCEFLVAALEMAANRPVALRCMRLPGAFVSLERASSYLLVEFECANDAPRQLLRHSARSLARELARRLECSVVVRVLDPHQPRAGHAHAPHPMLEIAP